MGKEIDSTFKIELQQYNFDFNMLLQTDSLRWVA